MLKNDIPDITVDSRHTVEISLMLLSVTKCCLLMENYFLAKANK